MSNKVEVILSKYGPMLSGELARKFEQEYGVSNTAARQALSRAGKPVNKICTLSFDRNQKFFYLESQYMSRRYVQSLLEAIEQASQVNWAYICAFRAQNGFVDKSILPSLVCAPIRRVKGHKLHERVVDDLLRCGVIAEYSETHWKLAEWIPIQAPSAGRAAGLETVKKQVVRDFASWAQNVNLIGYHSAQMLSAAAEFAGFQWAMTAPAYIQPLYDAEKARPGFVAADIVYGRTATVEDVRFFLDKLAVVRSFKKLPAFLPVLLVESVTPEALRELKEHKVMVALLRNMFGQQYTALLAEIVTVFSHASAIVARNPEKLGALFGELAKAEGRYNDIVGDMFELLVGYYFQHVGCRYLEIRKRIQIPDSGERNEIDVLVERDGEIIIVECKATQSALAGDYVEKWLSQTIHRIRAWALSRYPEGQRLRFQLWSLGGFTPEAANLLTSAAERTGKYRIEFFDKGQILAMARAQKVQPVVDILQQHFQPPLAKAGKEPDA